MTLLFTVSRETRVHNIMGTSATAQPGMPIVDFCFGLALTVATTVGLATTELTVLAWLPSDEAREAVLAALSCGGTTC